MKIALDESLHAALCDVELEFAAKIASAFDDVDVFGVEVAAVDEGDDALHVGVGRGVARKCGFEHAVVGFFGGRFVGFEPVEVEEESVGGGGVLFDVLLLYVKRIAHGGGKVG